MRGGIATTGSAVVRCWRIRGGIATGSAEV
jgi:hypothetical protein